MRILSLFEDHTLENAHKIAGSRSELGPKDWAYTLCRLRSRSVGPKTDGQLINAADPEPNDRTVA